MGKAPPTQSAANWETIVAPPALHSHSDVYFADFQLLSLMEISQQIFKKEIAHCSQVHCIRPSSVLSAGNWVCLPISPQAPHFDETIFSFMDLSFLSALCAAWRTVFLLRLCRYSFIFMRFGADSQRPHIAFALRWNPFFTLSRVLHKDNVAFNCLRSRILKGSIFGCEIAETNK